MKKSSWILTIVIMVLLGSLAIDIASNLEIYSPCSKNFLRMDLEKNNAEAVEYYISNYISKEKVLFSGPISQKLWCEYWEKEKPFPQKVAGIFSR